MNIIEVAKVYKKGLCDGFRTETGVLRQGGGVGC